ncbi:MAG: DUF2196 domain-containing protein [Ktedonobacteraceae bacterium]|nr:DUF2196 domain-containing protein [Ktedonobacteraceae bacterium]
MSFCPWQLARVVKDILITSASRSHDIKVRLVDGQAGRVQKIEDENATQRRETHEYHRSYRSCDRGWNRYWQTNGTPVLGSRIFRCAGGSPG